MPCLLNILNPPISFCQHFPQINFQITFLHFLTKFTISLNKKLFKQHRNTHSGKYNRHENTKLRSKAKEERYDTKRKRRSERTNRQRKSVEDVNKLHRYTAKLQTKQTKANVYN